MDRAHVALFSAAPASPQRRLILGCILLGLLFAAGAALAQVTEDQKLVGSGGGDYAEFGSAVALVETETEALALVGAPGDAELGADAGAVYAYRFDEAAGRWVKEAKFWPEAVGENAIIGRAIALSTDGRLALVAGREPGSNSEALFGRVYVFLRTDGAWVEQATLVASDETVANGFGCALALSADGSVIVVGACQAFGLSSQSGAVYVFRRDESIGEWRQEAKLNTERSCFFNAFGHAVAVSAAGDRAAVGERCGEGGDLPALHIFHQSGPPVGPNGGWTQEALFDDPSGGKGWGAVAISAAGDLVLSGTLGRVGVAVLEREGTTWTDVGSLTPSAGTPRFGNDAIVLNGDLALIGDIEADAQEENSGAAFLFQRRADRSWIEEAELAASDGSDFDLFGAAATLSERFAFVGAPWQGADALIGVVYTFDLARVVPTAPSPTASDALVLSVYPNPFVSALTLSYALPQPSRVRLAVYDVLGREVALITDEQQAAGGYRTQLKASHLPAGLYVVRLEAGGQHVTQRVVLLK